MKRLLCLLPLGLLLVACMGHKESLEDLTIWGSYAFNENDKSVLYKDTVTPPIRPFAPPTENTYTIEGTLTCQLASTYAFHPAVEATQTHSSYFLLDSDRHFIYFNNPLLNGLHTGDLIRITGEPYNIQTNQRKLVRGVVVTQVELVKDWANHLKEKGEDK